MEDPAWQRLAERLAQIHALPHNVAALAREQPPRTPAEATQHALEEVRTGLLGAPREETFVGPRLFLRAAGPGNGVHAGAWWFDADAFETLERRHARIHFDAAGRRAALRDLLREGLAVALDWNPMTELWALELAPGEALVGFTGIGRRMPRRAGRPEGRWLVGGLKQVYFPVKNPFAIRRYADLALG